MTTDAAVPRIGTFVDYYNPKLQQRIGFTAGYGGRGPGPYAAVVTNNLGAGLTLLVYLPGVTPTEVDGVPHQTTAGKHNPDAPPTSDAGKGYWDWQEPQQAVLARAAHAAAKAKETAGAAA